MDAATLDILQRHVPYGLARATSVPALMLAVNASDRKIRDGLEQLISERGLPIVTLAKNPGIFIATTPEELDLGDEDLRKRAMAILVRRRNLRRQRPRLQYSETLFGREVA
jgi:hypothetical protein